MSINDHIAEKFKFLEEYNFLSSVEMKTSLVDSTKKDTVFVFSNAFVEIKFKFYNFVDCDELRISIFRRNENKAFSFDEYLALKTTQVYTSLKEENSFDYISRIADLFHHEAKNDLKDVLLGNKWIEVPKNYGPYK